MTNHPNRRSAMAYVTLTTGGTVITKRSEVSSEALAEICRALDRDGRLGAWRIVVGDQSADGARYEMHHCDLRLARCWLCARATASDAWWDEAEAQAPDRVVLSRPRGTPWLATALDLDVVMHAEPATLMMLGDATRCVAWALYDRIRAG